MSGLSQKDLQEILRVLGAYPQIKRARLFGSRAKGTHSPGSDVDIALEGDITFDLVREVSRSLNQDSTMPYRFDILDYAAIESQELREHIDRVGIALLDRGPHTIPPV
jgi:predicted nucleotidyltransferase